MQSTTKAPACRSAKAGRLRNERRAVGAERKPIPKREIAARLEARFAVRLRSLMDERNVGIGDLMDKLHDQGSTVQRNAIHRWLRAETFPSIDDVQRVGRVFFPDDWRKILPLE